jgi:hypothetical protein
MWRSASFIECDFASQGEGQRASGELRGDHLGRVWTIVCPLLKVRARREAFSMTPDVDASGAMRDMGALEIVHPSP